ncbi:MAG TPA: signal peptidase I [Candidatus Angelobacter sp.]|nr:signal peptidase I [Candidatus Angelobacter sp.]
MNCKEYCVLARRWWHQNIRPLLILALVMFSARSSLADWNVVPSGSMQPTILVGDRVLVNKLAYDLKVPFTTWHIAKWSNPQRGDIVVFFSPKDGTRLIKRVIGLPGDTVELRNDRLLINGQPMDYTALEPQIPGQLSGPERAHGIFATEQLPLHAHAVMAINGIPAMRSFGPVHVPDGHYFMMGDNRDNSFDSRYFGTVDRGQIVGRATSVVLSLDKSNYWLPRWSRTGLSLDGNVE